MIIIFRAIILSLIGTASINLVYKADNIGILAGINIILFGLAIFILSKDEKEKASKTQENFEKIACLNSDKVEELKNLLMKLDDTNTSLNRDFKATNETLIKELKFHSDNIREEFKQYKIELISELNNGSLKIFNILKDNNSKIDELITAVNRNNITENLREITKVMENSNSINNKKFESILTAIAEYNKRLQDDSNRTYDLLEGQFKNLSEVMKQLNSISNEKLESILTAITECDRRHQDNADRMFDLLEGQFRNVSESSEELSDNLGKILAELENTFDKLNRLGKTLNEFKNETSSALEENINNNMKITKEYKEISGTMFNELNNLVEKNEHVVELLLNNYKVLNALMEG